MDCILHACKMTLGGVNLMLRRLLKDDEFCEGLFTYLNAKFRLRLDPVNNMQKFNNLYIYHETILALESLHGALLKIENGSAPTRSDYDKAKATNDLEAQSGIVEFYRKLVLVDETQHEAFLKFSGNYIFDSLISTYSSYFFDQREKLSTKPSNWKVETFQAETVFKYVEEYERQVEDGKLSISQSIQDEEAQQNYIHEKLIGDYNYLVQKNIQIGSSVIEIKLPSKLLIADRVDDSWSGDLLAKVIQRLQRYFENDNAILMYINHSHIVSYGTISLSYLIIYKTTVYSHHKLLYQKIYSQVLAIIGEVLSPKVSVVNQAAMLEKIYPNEKFVGELSSKKVKQAFSDKFLKYFLSSTFLINLDKNYELILQEELKGLILNKGVCFKDKVENLSRSKEREDLLCKPSKPSPLYLGELVKNFDSSEMDSYFTAKELPIVDVKWLQVIHLLYRQQAVVDVDLYVQEMMHIESFLIRLDRTIVYEFNKGNNSDGFLRSPTFNKLSFLFKQFVLLSLFYCCKNSNNISKKLSTNHSYRFLNHFFDRFQYKGYFCNDTRRLKRYLREEQLSLQADIQSERKRFIKADEKVHTIKSYLEQLLNGKDVLICRFIFKCGVADKEGAEYFDAMFRDYIENLKRRRTSEMYLGGHVAAYIPNTQEHYIDATLIFRIDDVLNEVSLSLVDDVKEYWVNYVQYKHNQILTHNKKHHKETMQGVTNPFEFFSDSNLIAEPVSVVLSECELDCRTVTIYCGQRKKQSLFIHYASTYYAHCPMILVKQYEYEMLSRKNCLILGRLKRKHLQKDFEVTTVSDSGSIVRTPTATETIVDVAK